MRRTLLVPFLVVSLSLGAAAEESLKLLIHSNPEGAVVKLNNREVGLTGVEFSLTDGHFPAGGLHLQLNKKNYKSFELIIPSSAKLATKEGVLTYPPDDPLVLEPVAFWVPIVEHPGRLAFPVLSLAAIGLVIRRNLQLKAASQAREARVQRLQDQIGLKHEFALQLVGPYRILELLGEGGIAKVFRAVPDSTLDESEAVAVKILHPHLSKEGDHNERFVREGKVSKELIHPNIVRLFEIDSDGDLVYLVLELLKGETLRDKLKRGDLPLDLARQILRQVFDSLSYAHGMRIVHRDLTPSNIMVDEFGVVKLMDFGLARRQEVGHTITVTGVIQGTPGYMAPEQLTETLDPRSDQYSLGVIMFEIFTGRRPIERGDAMQLIMATYQEDAPDPREFNPKVPAAIAELLSRMLRRDPNERFATIDEAAEAFYEAFPPGLILS